MKKIIILEGISSSGKTSICANLCRFCEERKISFSLLKEEETFMPMIDNTDVKKSVQYIREMMGNELKKEVKLHIVDRLEVSHGLKTGMDMSKFDEIETELVRNKALLVILTVAESTLFDRIEISSKYKDPAWLEHMLRHHGSIGAIVEFMKERQRLLLMMANQSKLEKLIIEVQGYDYVTPTRKIIDTLGLIENGSKN